MKADKNRLVMWIALTTLIMVTCVNGGDLLS